MTSGPESVFQASGIYVHVPFCLKKCAYCDFYSISDLDAMPIYLQALVKEIGQAGLARQPVDTVYFGGGTPSLLTPNQVRQVMAAVHRRFAVAEHAEITLEVNPGTVSGASLTGYRQAGVNRLNIGVQSFSDAALAFLSRIHSADQAIRCVEAARCAGFDNIGLDLIYGLPKQTQKQWVTDLAAAVALRPAHLSCYMLTYEPGARLAVDLKNHCFQALSDKAVGDLYDVTVAYLSDNGLPQYEVSNFSTDTATRSRHNRKYWVHAPYLGLGPAAHSFTENRRWWNIRSVDGYLGRSAAGQSPVAGSETLDRQQLMMEALYLGLRCVDGIAVAAFEERFGVDFKALFGPVFTEYGERGCLEIDNRRCRLTQRGMRFSDGIAARFIDRL